ncbi:hypothetical protein KIN20_032508 [Parelaphostrongylus tenuis]|uniref:Uncharacterized protein n=1 Tax=Parelaphostrongylus tenuis TaxID=148309 RepID=A0AAD5WIJ3_PARTN|nr:hypothetical protein KIN20_032508 [Parelaphostrongylus tenuis]
MFSYISSLAILVHVEMIDAWNCGIGPVSGAISYLIAVPGDPVGVDRCCVEHDTLIDDPQIAREEADRLFCQCLESKESW